MIRLNRIFGRKTTDGTEALAENEPHSSFAPPASGDEWDEDQADAYLLAQEQKLANSVDDQPFARDTAKPVDREPGRDATDQNRMIMARQQLAAAQAGVEVAPAALLDLSSPMMSDAGPVGRRAGRVKTRLLGFDHAPGMVHDPIDAARAAVPVAKSDSCPVGWIVVVRGPGRGAHFAVFNGVSQIGRGEEQAIRLDFGDGSISRANHAAIAYDDETNSFFLGHGGKTNIVRLNNRPVISTETLKTQDQIRIGETTLLFVALCGEGFRWAADPSETDDFG